MSYIWGRDLNPTESRITRFILGELGGNGLLQAVKLRQTVCTYDADYKIFVLTIAWGQEYIEILWPFSGLADRSCVELASSLEV